ncbi:hypothetical protein [Lignipirellula cremea]|uniref:Uncharacterized protein n=1 Tax=Lignipirellula cremea TaxID=2528010 RepID=A0A518DLS5_9BACT|nr:hypothetical protein [Lignipirellula cremea]QDU92771.1 hypothetical protein Pla8534_05200 [Lignipirellula cremea]
MAAHQYRFALFAALWSCAALCGCKSDPKRDLYIEAVNAEKRILEDRVYQMEYEVKLRDERLARLEKSVAKKGTAAEPTPAADPPPAVAPNITIPDQTPFEEELPDLSPVRPQPTRPEPTRPVPAPDLRGPDIDKGKPVGPDVLDGLGPNLNDGRGEPELIPAPQLSQVDAKPAPLPTDRRVTHIVVNKRLSGGHDFDRRAGDDGLALVIEPRNADDLFVPTPGSMSVVVLDRSQEGEAARVARWDFEASEIEQRLRLDPFRGRGVHLHLPWPADPPHGKDLAVFLRFETDDQRQLETRFDMAIALPGSPSVRWMPRPGVDDVYLPPSSPFHGQTQPASAVTPLPTAALFPGAPGQPLPAAASPVPAAASPRTASVLVQEPAALPAAQPTPPAEQLLAPPPGLSQPEVKEAKAPVWSPLR